MDTGKKINKIAIFIEPMKSWGQELTQVQIDELYNISHANEIIYVKSVEELMEQGLDADLYVGSASCPPPTEYYEKNQHLKWAHTMMSGFDGFMDHRFDDRIALTHTVGIHGAFMAEHVLAYIMAFARRLPQAFEKQYKKEYARIYGFRQVRGCTALVVGFGSIGTEVCKLLRQVGMRVEAVNRSEPSEEKKQLVDCWYLIGELDRALPTADYVILTVPMSNETFHLIGEKQLEQMKETAILINIARGKVVDGAALCKALNDSVIGGAALDAHYNEPMLPDDPMWDAPNTILTAHIASGMPDYLGLALKNYHEEIKRYLAGEAFRYRAN